MSDKLAGGCKAGSTSVSLNMPKLRALADGAEVTGKAAATLTAYYWRQGGSPTAITLADLGAIDSAWSSGGVKEADATNMKGSYRLDVPDAAFATGADWVEIDLFSADSFVSNVTYALETKGAAEVFTLLSTVQTAVNAIKAKTDNLAFTVANKVDATLQAAADFAQAAADKVWLTSSRPVTSVPTVSLTNSVWDEVAASHNTAGTMGQKLNAAGGATDPLTNTVPGTYVAGTAGYVLGNLSSDSASIAAIKTKTDQLTFTVPNVVDASGGASAAAIAAAVLNTAMTEGYAADGAPATLAQMQYMLWAAAAAEKVISGTTMTVKKLDGTTTAMVFQLNDSVNPTSITRSS